MKRRTEKEGPTKGLRRTQTGRDTQKLATSRKPREEDTQGGSGESNAKRF